MEFLNVLSREEMKNRKGGNMSTCVIYTAAGIWYCGYTYEEAVTNYNESSLVTRYCCAICGQTGFLGYHY